MNDKVSPIVTLQERLARVPYGESSTTAEEAFGTGSRRDCLRCKDFYEVAGARLRRAPAAQLRMFNQEAACVHAFLGNGRVMAGSGSDGESRDSSSWKVQKRRRRSLPSAA